MSSGVQRILFIEPFHGGSHQQLMELLHREFGGSLLTLPATKWHWRMRVSALHFAMNIPHHEKYGTLFASSVLNLCELVSLRPDLASLKKVLYFHENQLVYPTRKQQDRDFQYGYNQILSCLVADVILFNSHFNMSSFLDSIDIYLKLMPDYRPKGLADLIRPKCRILYFPLELPTSDLGGTRRRNTQREPELTAGEGAVTVSTPKWGTPEAAISSPNVEEVNADRSTKKSMLTPGITEDGLRACSSPKESSVDCDSIGGCGSPRSQIAETRPLHILWPHRWEHDKGPNELCSVLTKLLDSGVDFHISILGAHTNDIPESFEAIFPQLGNRLLHCGHLPREKYWAVLRHADVVISTAHHEFFGVAMLEAVYCGCYPLCPNRLVYPELYPGECLYNTEQQLFKRLRRFCHHPQLARQADVQINFTKFMWDHLRSDYLNILCNGH